MNQQLDMPVSLIPELGNQTEPENILNIDLNLEEIKPSQHVSDLAHEIQTSILTFKLLVRMNHMEIERMLMQWFYDNNLKIVKT